MGNDWCNCGQISRQKLFIWKKQVLLKVLRRVLFYLKKEHCMKGKKILGKLSRRFVKWWWIFSTAKRENAMWSGRGNRKIHKRDAQERKCCHWNMTDEPTKNLHGWMKIAVSWMLAERILNIPANLAPCEWVFSLAADIVNIKMARLSSENANVILFLKVNEEYQNWTIKKAESEVEETN